MLPGHAPQDHSPSNLAPLTNVSTTPNNAINGIIQNFMIQSLPQSPTLNIGIGGHQHMSFWGTLQIQPHPEQQWPFRVPGGLSDLIHTMIGDRPPNFPVQK